MALGNIGALVQGLLADDSFLTQIVLYNAVGQILEPLLAPYIQELLNDTQSAHQFVPLSPADLADMVIRGVKQEGDARSQAIKSGIDPDDFHNLVLNNGEPPGLEAVMQWYRRGIIGWDDVGVETPSVERAIKTSRLKNYWTDVIFASQWLPLTVADAVNGIVRHQIDEETGYRYLKANGIRDPEARTLINITGRPMAPEQLVTAVNRGWIPLHGAGPDVLSLQQGIYEGDLKNKWEPIYERMIEKVPSIFEINRLLSSGAITPDLGFRLLREEGLSDELAHSIVDAASKGKLVKAKNLSQSLVEKQYVEKFISHDQAVTELQALGYTAPEAGYVLAVVDEEQHYAALKAAVTNIRGKYLARRISEDNVKTLLGELGVVDAQVAALLSVWNVEQQAQVRILTEAQIVDAVEYKIATADWAITELQGLGYSPRDAWMLISLKLKERAPNPPEGVPAAPPAEPTTGATSP